MKRRTYDGDYMTAGVQTAVRPAMHVLRTNMPTAVGPLAAVPSETGPTPEVLNGHCLGCKGKRQFTVDGEDKMKNGVVRKFGKCTGPGCSRTISTFVKGVSDAPA